MSAVPAVATSGGRLSQRHIARSEWTKLRSVRSTRWALAATVLLIIGIGLIVCMTYASRWPHLSARDRASFHPLSSNLGGVNLAALSIGVLGVLVMTAEYSTGMIRSTFSAVPKRLPALWGKALVFGVVAFAVSLLAILIVFFVGQAILSGVARALVGAALALTVMGLFGLGLGAIVRNTAGGIALLVGIMFVLPPILNLLPATVTNSIDSYLPSNAAGAVWTINPDAQTLAPWAGLAVFAAYAALSLAIAAALLNRRDT